jgi:hypothetical protein
VLANEHPLIIQNNTSLEHLAIISLLVTDCLGVVLFWIINGHCFLFFFIIILILSFCLRLVLASVCAVHLLIDILSLAR